MHQTILALLLQFALASLAFAAPVTIQSNSWQYGTGGGIIGFIVFILDVIVISKFSIASYLTHELVLTTSSFS